MNRTVFFVFFLVLVAAIAYFLFTTEKAPEKGITMTPKEYIERVEQKKAERQEQSKRDGSETINTPAQTQ